MIIFRSALSDSSINSILSTQLEKGGRMNRKVKRFFCMLGSIGFGIYFLGGLANSLYYAGHPGIGRMESLTMGLLPMALGGMASFFLLLYYKRLAPVKVVFWDNADYFHLISILTAQAEREKNGKPLKKPNRLRGPFMKAMGVIQKLSNKKMR